MPPVLHHVALETNPPDGDAARRFWEILGFTEVDPPETLRDRAAWFERDGTQIHVLWTDTPVVPSQGHAAVVVPSFEVTVGRLREAGFDVERRNPHWGVPRAFATAPGGHRVELMSAPPFCGSPPAGASTRG